MFLIIWDFWRPSFFLLMVMTKRHLKMQNFRYLGIDLYSLYLSHTQKTNSNQTQFEPEIYNTLSQGMECFPNNANAFYSLRNLVLRTSINVFVVPDKRLLFCRLSTVNIAACNTNIQNTITESNKPVK